MELVTYNVKKTGMRLNPSWALPRGVRELRIVPLGDIQLGSDTDYRRLKSYVQWIKRIGAYVIGMGDYIDLHSPSNRQIIEQVRATAYDSTVRSLDEGPLKLLNEVTGVFDPIKDRFLGLIRGHHWCQFSGKTGDSTTVLAQRLGSRNLGDCAMLELDFGDELKTVIWAHHGTGSGWVASSALTRLEHMTKTFFADIYLMGHQTKKGVSVIPWVSMEDGKERGKNRYIVATGGFSKGYVAGSVDPWGNPAGNYVERKMLPPVALGAPLLMIRPLYDARRVDINVSV